MPQLCVKYWTYVAFEGILVCVDDRGHWIARRWEGGLAPGHREPRADEFGLDHTGRGGT